MLIGCDNPSSSSSDDPPTGGTVTVQLTGATDLNGDGMSAFLYSAGEHSIYTPGKLLVCNGGTVASGTAYDIYIGTDRNADGDDQPATTGGIGGGEAYRAANYPMTFTLNGSKTIDLAFGDLVEYTGGTLSVSVSGATDDVGEEMFFGVFLAVANPETDDSIAYGAATVDAGGGAKDTADQEGGGDWYGVDGTSHDLYVFIDRDGTGTDGPTSGDLTYEETYTQSGTKTVTLDAGGGTGTGDFTVFP